MTDYDVKSNNRLPVINFPTVKLYSHNSGNLFPQRWEWILSTAGMDSRSRLLPTEQLTDGISTIGAYLCAYGCTFVQQWMHKGASLGEFVLGKYGFGDKSSPKSGGSKPKSESKKVALTGLKPFADGACGKK